MDDLTEHLLGYLSTEEWADAIQNWDYNKKQVLQLARKTNYNHLEKDIKQELGDD